MMVGNCKHWNEFPGAVPGGPGAPAAAGGDHRNRLGDHRPLPGGSGCGGEKTREEEQSCQG